jgi:aryl-alcohol dehydrogenase-like predicted oxidoreductase
MNNLVNLNNIGFGGAALTNINSYTEIKKLLICAYENGINHFDTAPLYGKGYSEVIYGNFIKNKRNKITITTKFGLGEGYNTLDLPLGIILKLNYYLKKIKFTLRTKDDIPTYTPQFKCIDKNLIEKSLLKSLKRLRTDYLDYYLLHEGLPNYLTDEALTFIHNLKQKGIVRFIGLGTNLSSLIKLNKEDLANWDILQYDVGSGDDVKYLMEKLSDKIHFHHSSLKRINAMKQNLIALKDRAGYILAQDALMNPSGKVIFSTQNIDHLRNNISAFSKYQTKS